MNIVVHANGVQWQKEYLQRFLKGFRAQGLTATHTTHDAAMPAAINVVFANNSWKNTVAECKRNGAPLLTVGRCFFGSRHDMVAIGWDGFNGDANFCLEEKMPCDRWEKHGFELPSYNFRSGPILVCGEFRDMRVWYSDLWRVLKDENVIFRPHPFTKDHHGFPPAPDYGQDDIASLLEKVSCCITHDSIAGCDAVLNGCRSITYGDRSMARQVSFTSIEDYLINATTMKDRTDWCNQLAYCQWSHDEIESGEFWTHLSTRFPDMSTT